MNTTPSPATAGGVLAQALSKVRARAEEPGTAQAHGPKFSEGMRCAANMIERKCAAILAAFGSAAPAGEPHCTGHESFDYDCIDCSDALERQRKAATPAGGGAYDSDILPPARLPAWNSTATETPVGGGGEFPTYGIIDPDYARVFTIARCLAWAEGYALAMHGSFTRDLDLIAVPWTDAACKPEHLMRRIEDAAGLTNTTDEPSQKPHGRLVWTLMFPGFSDPRFVDLGILSPCRLASLASTGSAPAPSAWRPIETAPKDGRRVLLAKEGSGRPAFCGFFRQASQCWTDESCGARDPTHWQPLPAAPTQEQQG